VGVVMNTVSTGGDYLGVGVVMNTVSTGGGY
jgi:hypothetical protein